MTRRTLSLILAVGSLLACGSCTSHVTTSADDPVQYVEPRIGTAHCRYFHFAPGALPFGMAKPGPSTNGHLGNKDGWEATGYDYRDTSIEGFPCVHEFQVGGITLMPTTGTLITVPGRPTDKERRGYRSRFSHDDEVATAGYYAVLLQDYGIRAEMTATTRVAYQRYTYPASEESHLLFNIGSRMGESGAVKDAEVRLNDDGTIEGYVVTLPEYVKKYQPGAEVPIYFSAVVDKKPTAWGIFMGRNRTPDVREAKGVGAGLYLTFPTKEGEKVTAKVGISYTSVENARRNRVTEARRKSFDQVRQQAHAVWQEHLSRIAVETDKREDKVKFYSGLYHAILGRGICSDVSGDYPRHDGTIGHVPMKDGKPAFNIYNTDAMWGGQWNLTQVWALAYPEHLSDFISSHLQVYKDSGWLGDGLANSRYVSGVGTNQLSLMIAAAYACGIRDFDVELAYEACRKNELEGSDRPLGAGKSDTDQFVAYGYVPHAEAGDGPDETFMFSASHTLEYSFSAWATAQLAQQLGHADDARQLMSLSKGWERIYDSSSGFVRPRLKDGRWIENFNSMQVWRGFQEGNAWQYTFYVPHDVEALVAKVGAETFVARLDSIFTLSQPKIFSGGTEIGAFAGLRTLYNQGNQPCLHIPWLFNEAGRPELTQKWVRAILDEFYGTDGIHGYGYGQDEDQGQLGAWYVISSIGLFDVAGLTAAQPSFGLGSPLFDRVTLRLNNHYYSGKEFVIETTNNTPGNIYVEEYTLNGQPLSGTRIPFADIVKGGKLEVKLTNAAQ
ncbi:MAG: GH92 family glycosyl hydrolase [Bacteroidaceae bacterium]|nr:GH92 family glycosyl hydrolase [Bacteroidaceae bacterium]